MESWEIVISPTLPLRVHRMCVKHSDANKFPILTPLLFAHPNLKILDHEHCIVKVGAGVMWR
jgi:hypothetical protein